MVKKSLLSQCWLRDQRHDHHAEVHPEEVHRPGGDDRHHQDIETEGHHHQEEDLPRLVGDQEVGRQLGGGDTVAQVRVLQGEQCDKLVF